MVGIAGNVVYPLVADMHFKATTGVAAKTCGENSALFVLNALPGGMDLRPVRLFSPSAPGLAGNGACKHGRGACKEGGLKEVSASFSVCLLRHA
jgi:hypothetical protein